MINSENFFAGKKVWFVRSRFSFQQDIPNNSIITLIKIKGTYLSNLKLHVYAVEGYNEKVIQDEIYENYQEWCAQNQEEKQKIEQKYIPISGYI